MKHILLFSLSILLLGNIAFSQNVGVGTPNPGSKFEIKGDVGTAIFNAMDNLNITKLMVDADGQVGIGIANPLTSLHINATDAAVIPVGTTAQRPSSPPTGSTRFNSDSKSIEYFDGTQWVSANMEQVPIGTIVPFAGPSIPGGWLLCDGSAVSSTTYSELYSAIGFSWGNPGGGNFNLPDLRGRFVRGVDAGTGRDPDSGTRTASNSGGNTGNNIGSVQDHAIPNHTINVSGNTGNDGGHEHTWGGWWSNDNASVVSPPYGDGGGNTYSDNYVGYWNNYFPSTTNGGHSHGGSTGNPNSSAGYWFPFDDNLASNTRDIDMDDNPTQCGTGWNGRHTVGNFMGRFTDACLGHTHSIGYDGDHSHSTYMPNHRHWMQARNTYGGGVHTHTINLSANGIAGTNVSSETRPKNVNVQYIIKAQNTGSVAIKAVNIPNGVFGQTLRYDGSNWIANSTLYNNGTNIGMGTTNPQFQLDVAGKERIRLSGQIFTTDNTGALELNNAGSGAAYISFHREGAYGAHFGLDTDNWFSTQGWSAGGGYTSLRTGILNATGGLQYNGVSVIFNSSTDVYGNFRVLQSNSTINDGMYLNYNSTGGAAAHLRFFANGTTQRGYFDANNGYLYTNKGIRISTDNVTGNGLFLADDGSMVDNNDGYATMRFSSGMAITDGNNSNTQKILLRNDGNIQMVNNGSPTLNFNDSDEPDYYLHANTDRLYFLHGDGYNAWNTNRPLTIYQGNKVGIGTATPQTTLDVSTGLDGIAMGQIHGDNTNTIQSYIDGQWANRAGYASGCCNALLIQPDVGVVGIRTSAPQATLDVRGQTLPTGTIIAAGNNYATDWPSGWGGGLSSWDICVASIRYSGLSQRSDERLKKDITTLNPESSLDIIKKLRPVSYGYHDDRIARKLHYGFIAQEVQKILPEIVEEGIDSMKTLGMSYIDLIPLLTNAIQEQQKQIDELKQQNALLSAERKAINSSEYNKLQAEIDYLKDALMKASK